MSLRFVEKERITLIGREGLGDGDKGSQWVPPLWRDMQLHMSEVASLVKRDESGKPCGIWGAMSDSARRYLPWESDGLYLAGFEVDDDAAAPEGWVKWVLPAFRYAVAECTPENYGAVFQRVIWHELPECGCQLVGAVQEYYDPQALDGKMLLYFPVTRR